MKYLFFLACAVALSGGPLIARARSGRQSRLYTVRMKQKWRKLDKHADRFGGEWVLIGKIKFGKGTPVPIQLYEINLKWHGSTLKEMIGSLYRKVSHKPFMPTNDYFIADSYWDPDAQTLHFKFDEPDDLGQANTYYLVLTVPEDLQDNLNYGRFELLPTGLPKEFRPCASNEPIQLTFSSQHTHSHTAA